MYTIGGFIQMVFRITSILFRLILAGVLISVVAFFSFIVIKGSQPVGMLGANSSGSSVEITDLNYWQAMINLLEASRLTPNNCHQTRLIFLAMALPIYPALYIYVGLYPESDLARHVPDDRLIPGVVSWSEIPNIWWGLVKEVSWMAFTQPLWDFTPAVGQRVMVDEMCSIPEFEPNNYRSK